MIALPIHPANFKIEMQTGRSSYAKVIWEQSPRTYLCAWWEKAKLCLSPDNIVSKLRWWLACENSTLRSPHIMSNDWAIPQLRKDILKHFWKFIWDIESYQIKKNKMVYDPDLHPDNCKYSNELASYSESAIRGEASSGMDILSALSIRRTINSLCWE